MFAPDSRYSALETVQATLPDGRTVTYKRRRIVPPGASLAQLTEVTVAQGDRLDNLTARTLGEPTRFWQICDAADALDPSDLIVAARRLRVPQP
jgi:hypothetical protein